MEYFLKVEKGFKNLQGILDVSTNATTGSILLLHQLSLEPIARHARHLQLFEVAQPEASPRVPVGQYVEQAIAVEGIAENLIRLDPKFRNIVLGTLVGADSTKRCADPCCLPV